MDKQLNFLWGEDAKRLLGMEDPMGYLVASEGWKLLGEIAQGMKQVRIDLLLAPSRPPGPSDEFLKGAIYGINLLLDTPKTIMSQAEDLHAERAKEIA